MTDYVAETQSDFVALAKNRLADPMVTENPRTESTLDPNPFETVAAVTLSDEEPGDPIIAPTTGYERHLVEKWNAVGAEEFSPEEIAESEGTDIDVVPLTFEEEVMSRLQYLDEQVCAIRAGNTQTHDAITKIVTMVEAISTQVEPVMAQIMESKLFRMFIPTKKVGA